MISLVLPALSTAWQTIFPTPSFTTDCNTSITAVPSLLNVVVCVGFDEYTP